MFRPIKRVVCGISGGVDSAVAALLLKQKGYEVVGLFMKNWDKTDEVGECQADKDFEDAQFVCNHLKIPLHQVNFVKDYWNEVFSPFLLDLQRGITSVPDIYCNRYIKFNMFYKVARNNFQADAIATGHYARTSIENDLENADLSKGVRLLQSYDRSKDQTFFLSQIPQKALEMTMFPVGNLYKSEVKKIAQDAGMERISKKRESMGICFIGKTDFKKFLDNYIESNPGNFIDFETKEVVGRHKGLHQWTIGQRAHLGGSQKAYFVVSKNVVTNDIEVVKGTDHPALLTKQIYVDPPFWINQPPEDLYQNGTCAMEFKCHVIHRPHDCTVDLNEDKSLTVHTPSPGRGIAAGQFTVLYRGEECLGSARIRGPGPSLYEQNLKTMENEKVHGNFL